MTVSAQINRTSATGSGSTGQEVPFTFPITATSDLTVIKRVTATGVETSLSETTNYTISISGDTGGTLTTVTAIETTEEIHIIRNTPKTQALDLEAGGSYNAENIEDALDKNTKLIIENKDALDRTLRAPATDSLSLDLEIPNSADRASKNLGFDASGNVTVTDSSGTFATANAYWDDIIAKSPWKDVRAYGAEGDGTTDDTAAIQAAIDSVSADDGARIYFPTGVYIISDTLTIPTIKYIWLVGNGIKSEIKNDATDGSDAISFEGVVAGTWNRGIEKMTIRGNASSGDGVSIATTSTHTIIKDTTILGHGDYGVRYTGATHYNTLIHCSITTNASGGVIYEASANANAIYDCYIDDNDDTAVYIAANGIKIFGGSMENNDGRVLYITSVSDILVEGVWFESNNSDGGTESIYITNSNHVIIRDCRLHERKDWHLLGTSTDVVFENCLFVNVTGNTPDLLIDATCGRNYIERCRFNGSPTIRDKSFNSIVRDIRMESFYPSASTSHLKLVLKLPKVRLIYLNIRALKMAKVSLHR